MTDLARRAERPRRVTRSFSVEDARIDPSDDGKTLNFVGYASTTEQPYEMRDALGTYHETISRSAFDRTLSQNPDVVFLVNHADLPLARTKSGTLDLSADSVGLRAQATFDATDPDVQRLAPKVERGDLDEMSFAFYIEDQSWSPDYSEVRINEVNMHRGDVSLVTFGANPTTFVSSMRSLLGDDADFDAALEAVKSGDATPAQRDLVARAATILSDLTSEPTSVPVVDPAIDIWRKRLEMSLK